MNYMQYKLHKQVSTTNLLIKYVVSIVLVHSNPIFSLFNLVWNIKLIHFSFVVIETSLEKAEACQMCLHIWEFGRLAVHVVQDSLASLRPCLLHKSQGARFLFLLSVPSLLIHLQHMGNRTMNVFSRSLWSFTSMKPFENIWIWKF